MTQITALANYIIIAVPKVDEKEKREKEGRFFVPSGVVMYQRNTQNGEIISIGSGIKEHIGDIKKGHTALVHHSVQGSMGEGHLNRCFEDEANFYYPVCCSELQGQRNSFFGVWDGEKIVAHEDYVFLEYTEPEKGGIKSTESGLFVVEYKNNRDEVFAKIAKNKEIIQNISKGVNHAPVAERIQALENENRNLMKPFSGKRAMPFKVVSIHKSYGIKNGSTIYVTASATSYILDFMGTKYIVAETKYIHAFS